MEASAGPRMMIVAVGSIVVAASVYTTEEFHGLTGVVFTICPNSYAVASAHQTQHVSAQFSFSIMNTELNFLT
jgi:hypothetical protein